MTHGRVPVPTEKPFYEAAGKQTQFPGRFSQTVPSNTSAAGAGLPGHLLPIGPAPSTALQRPARPSLHHSCTWQSRVGSGRQKQGARVCTARGQEERKGRHLSVDLESLPELQMARWAPFQRSKPTPSGGGCRAGGGQRGWKGRQKCTDQKEERERIPSQPGMAEVGVVPSAGAEVPREPALRVARRCGGSPGSPSLGWCRPQLCREARMPRPWPLAGRGVARMRVSPRPCSARPRPHAGTPRSWDVPCEGFCQSLFGG